ncbi:MAG: FkbM family methyltransferase [Selenomonas ruminantium]|nr:FkbM family methyltransferase [Selenomonas ruminantium]
MEDEVKVLKSRIENLEKRLSWMENRYNNELEFRQLGGRIDFRLIRLEMLSYYHNKGRYWQLDETQRRLLDDVEDNLLKNQGRHFFKERYFEEPVSMSPQHNPIVIEEKDGLFYWSIRGGQVFLSKERKHAEQIAGGLYREFFQPSPHNYFDLETGFTVDSIPEGAVVADVGSAEGLFGMLLVQKAKKVYLFENSSYWMPMLEKTYAPYKDKVEIVQGTVGDGAGDIRLDDFFRDREKPTLVKMDVEGYEASVLRGMRGLISSPDMMTMLICTYHRQEDWPHFYDLLKDNFEITSSPGYYWHMPDPMPPFFRHGVMRAVKKAGVEE